MARENINNIVPAKKQIWEHVVTKTQFVVLEIADDAAICMLLDEGAATKLRVSIPLAKLAFRSNRGMAMVGQFGKLPKVGVGEIGEYNPRNKNFGAL